MKNFLYWLIVAIAGFAVYGSFGLVLDEIRVGNLCPKIAGIPACYIVLVCFAGAFIAHLIPAMKGKWIYFIFVGVVTILATTGTIGELAGTTKCPRTGGGIPMCFISLAVCVSLLIAKIFQTK